MTETLDSTTTRAALANVIVQYSSITQYVSGRDTIAELDCSYHKTLGIVEFATRINAITFDESIECKQTLRDIHDAQGSLRKCARLPVTNGERSKHYAHLQSHSVAATAARVATLASRLRVQSFLRADEQRWLAENTTA
jgi:hypothetical protein